MTLSRSVPVFLFLLVVCISLLSSACTRNQERGQVLQLAIWSNYLTAEFLKSFTEKTGIRVETTIYSSNEELLAKLQAGASGYDVAVPSDYMVLALRQLGLLLELDPAALPNRAGIDPKFLGKAFDPKGTHSVPFVWGTTGIAFNRDLVPGGVRSYRELLSREDLKGKFTLLDDAREAIGAALKSQGLSLNTRSPEDLERAKRVLLEARGRIKAFTSEILLPMASGEIAVAHAFMTDALQARKRTSGKVEFVLPAEGGTLWIDNLVIPRGARNVAGAHRFINYLLEPSSAVATVQAVFVAPVNPAVQALLPPALQRDGALFPAPKQLKNHEMIEDIGDFVTQWDRIWTEVKVAD